MRLIFSENAWADYLFWQKTDKKVVKRINQLIGDIQRNKYDGLGKPEPLRFNLSGWWSRRINEEHRLVYKIEDESILLNQRGT